MLCSHMSTVSSCPCGFSEILLTIVGLGIISFDTYFSQISFRLCRKKKSFLVLHFMSQIILSEVTHLLFWGPTINKVLSALQTFKSRAALHAHSGERWCLLSEHSPPVSVAVAWWTPVSHGRWLKWILIFAVDLFIIFPDIIHQEKKVPLWDDLGFGSMKSRPWLKL